MKKLLLLFSFVLIFIIPDYAQQKPTKLYWFIPDGVRAEPDLFKLFEWAKQGYLPHIKYMIEQVLYLNHPEVMIARQTYLDSLKFQKFYGKPYVVNQFFTSVKWTIGL